MAEKKEDARTRFLLLAEEILEHANTDEKFGTERSDDIRQITEWQGEMLNDPQDGATADYERRVEFAEKLAPSSSAEIR